MAKTTLYSSLYDSIESDKLEYLGKIKVPLTSAKKGLKSVILDANATVQVLHGTINGSSSIQVAEFVVLNTQNLTNIVIDEGYNELTLLLPKYNIRAIEFEGTSSYKPYVNMKDYMYTTINAFTIINGKIDSYAPLLSKSGIQNINISGLYTEILNELDVTDLGSNSIMQSINLSSIRSSNLKGSLDKCGLSNASTLLFPNTKTVSLTIENFVANNRSKGRTTGSKSLPYVGACDCKFNNQSVINQETNTLSWDATTITFNGVTIEA